MINKFQRILLLGGILCCNMQGVAGGTEIQPEILISNSLTMVTKEDYETELYRLAEEYRIGVETSPERIHQLLRNILMIKSLAAEARQLKMDQDPAINRQMQWNAEKALANLRRDKLLTDAINTLNETSLEQRAQELYRLDKDKYTEKATAKASHILISLQGRTKDEALARAIEARKRALNGEAFEALVMEYSDDPSAKANKGDLGFFTAEEMAKPFSDAVFSMNGTGDVSEPVETQFGIHVILLHEKKPAHLKKFEEVKAELILKVKEKYLADLKAEHLGKIANDKNTYVNEDAIAKLRKNMAIEKKMEIEKVQK